jgi:hypothetical protein
MPESQHFPYTVNNSEWGEASLMPYLPLTLIANQKSANISALVDSGAAASILPYDVGLQLGFVWEEQTTIVHLSGNLAGVEARGVMLTAVVGEFEPVRLVFAWAKSNDLPAILGQTNFFMEFKVHFYRMQQAFEIEPK